MPKRRYPWWGTADAILKGRGAVDRAVIRVQAAHPEADVARFCRMVYFSQSNTQEGAAALIGIDRRTANDINRLLHFYIAEEMGYFEAKNG